MGKKDELKKLEARIKELYKLNSAMGNNKKVNDLGRARDRSDTDLKNARQRMTRATDGLSAAVQELREAIAFDRRAAEAWLANLADDDGEEDVGRDLVDAELKKTFESAAAATKAKRQKHEDAVAEFAAAEKELNEVTAERQKLDKEDDACFQEMLEVQAEVKAIEAKCNVLKKEIADNPSLATKLKKLLQ